ncbi:MAG: septal ring lytic transglycosylase RlpA family protein [Rhodoferax sp.]
MPDIFLSNRLARLALVWAVGVCAAGFAPDTRAAGNAAPSASARQRPSPAKVQPDLSGDTRVGKASIFAKRFAGRKMADGSKMDPHGDNAASKTLPLGTTAKVTHLGTGLSAIVTIQDRGPYVKGRIVDLSPSTARKIGIAQHHGVARVQVDPIAVPMPDGSVKAGVAAEDAQADQPTSGDHGR